MAAHRSVVTLRSAPGRTQAAQALSSPKAETYGIGSGIVEGLGIKTLLEELGETAELAVESDSSSGIMPKTHFSRSLAARSGPVDCVRAPHTMSVF